MLAGHDDSIWRLHRLSPLEQFSARGHPKEAIMACTCFSLGVWRRPADKGTQDAITSSSHRAFGASEGTEPPQMVPDHEDTLSLASCSLSFVDAGGYQDPLRLNIPFVPANGLTSRRSSNLSRETRSLDLPQVFLARTQASKEEISLLRKTIYQNTTRSSIGSMHLGSRCSLELASDMALAQLGTSPEGPCSEHSPSNLHKGSLSKRVDPLATTPGTGAEWLDAGSSTSPFARAAMQVISPASSHASESAEPAADMSSSSLPRRAISRSPDEATEDSTCRLASAIQEAEACRTSSEPVDDEVLSPGMLMCSSDLLKAEDHLMQSSHSKAVSPQMQSGTQQRPTASLAMCSVPERTQPTAFAAHQASVAFSLAGNGTSNYSEARAQRRRTRAITVMPDQENLLAIQAAIQEGPEAAVQRPLKSRTNLLRRRATSPQAGCDSCNADALLRAAFCGVPSGSQTGQHVWDREDAYKPLSAQFTCNSILIDSKSKHTQAADITALLVRSGEKAENGLRRDLEAGQEASKGGTLNAGKPWWAPPVPTYMQSTASMRAKADVATQQVKACKASQRDKRRWTY